MDFVRYKDKLLHAVYMVKHTKPIILNAVLLNVKADGIYSYHWVLKG